ncbi:MAG: photosystem I assembly protein Ycf3 [Euryarchaeota archaeon ADurb.Bin190]|jgi:tetratricopeptide (TPR) repeat protein|nr:MAG: photosystem I assembly protein Ycf3 [Euryarchaeota archaeon ADurb.Bin190]
MDFRDSKGAIINPTGKVEQHIGDQYNNYIQQIEKFPVPHQIPATPRNFIGRGDLISEILAGFTRGATVIGLRGIGGLGKTALAYKLAELLRDRYKDGQLMVNLQATSATPLTPSQAMSKLLRYYYPQVPLPESQEELQSIYLSTLDGKSVLLLLDNALDDQQVMHLLPPSSCGMIITSRRKLAFSDVFPIDLEVLKLEEARELLIKTARPHSPGLLPAEEPIWNEIARICGRLPVTLKAAGSYLACTPGSSPAKYVKELQDERKRLGIIGKEGVEEDLVTKLSLSYGRLAPETARVFRLLSIFPADFYAQAEEAACLDEGHRNLIELERWSLVDYEGSAEEGEGRYHLHDLVRLFALGLLEKEEDSASESEAWQRYSEHYRDVLSNATEIYQNGDPISALKIFDLERANIESSWEWAKKNPANICSSILNSPYILELRLHPLELISRLETALAGARKLNDRGMEGAHLGNMGNAYVDLGEPRQAIEHYEQALAIAREIGDRMGEGACLGGLGLAYADLGEIRQAIELYEHALAIAREIGDRRDEGVWLGSLGLAYAALGEPRQAIEHFKQILKFHREIGDRSSEGLDLGNLGNAYAALGETRKAIEHYGQRLIIAREIGDRRGEANALFNSSLVLFDLGKNSEAIEKAEIALQIYEQIDSPYADRVKQELAEWRR